MGCDNISENIEINHMTNNIYNQQINQMNYPINVENYIIPHNNINNIGTNPNIKNCFICGESFGRNYIINNSNGVRCCKCSRYSDFNKKFKCNNCNSEFCFTCGQQNNYPKNLNCFICGENFGRRYIITTSNGVNCCKCSSYSSFDKKFKCHNCNSEFCFQCGQEYNERRYFNCFICGESC